MQPDAAHPNTVFDANQSSQTKVLVLPDTSHKPGPLGLLTIVTQSAVSLFTLLRSSSFLTAQQLAAATLCLLLPFIDDKDVRPDKDEQW